MNEPNAEDDVKAAIEFWRRHLKGLPTDRYADGSDGMKAVARGIGVMWTGFLDHMDQQYRAGLEAMEPSADPCRQENESRD